MNSVSDVWENVLNHLRESLSQTTIATWFDEIEPVEIQGNSLLLHCGNDFKRGYIESLFMKHIKMALRDLFSMEFQVQVLDDRAFREFQDGAPKHHEKGAFTTENFTFESFIEGPSNKLACAASRNVAENPARNYNPLLIYGASGLGKTHLIHAIANHARKKFPRFRITYAKGDDLANELIASIQEGRASVAGMREKYRKADILLIDDVQFIAGKKQTQEEFFHTFNALYESGKQIVLTSDRPPHEITTLEERLRTRFEWGLLADVEPPDFETRVAIIRAKAASSGIVMPDEIANYIAEKVTANVRQLEGAINKLTAYKELLQNDTDPATVRRAVQDIIKSTTEYVPTPDVIVAHVGGYYDVEPEDIRSQKRGRNYTTARQVAMYLIRSMTTLSQDEIGDYFNGRDHSTVIYSLRQIENRMREDSTLAETVREIKTNISSSR